MGSIIERMYFEPIPVKLLHFACPSIRYRIHSEILGHSITKPDMLNLQNQILRDPSVQEILSWQQPDGWPAWDLHARIQSGHEFIGRCWLVDVVSSH